MDRGLVEHPTRERWNPGAGGMCCHSIQLDPDDAERMYIGDLGGGRLPQRGRRRDLDAAQQGHRRRLHAGRQYPEVGQCVHKLLVHPGRPERLWQQNHCGVYRSDDRGDTWERLDGNGLPSDFGFPIAIDPRDPDMACVIPEGRCTARTNRVTG